VNKKGEEKTFTVRDILIATGCRPNYPDIPGAKEFGITSDDLFSLPYSPGKTLCVGGSYIALESAGVLASFGFDVTVMLRSVVLRGFDQQFAKMIQENLVAEGVVFVEGYVPTSVELIKEGTPPTLKVTGKKTNPLAKGKGIETEDKDSVFVMEFNTVLFAVGRQPCTKNIGLETAKVKISEE
jgi:pyruvate/2-oxoglutarate dehydrogenase complex dihydrolipoamide dehydrogenase (E3) component